MMYRIVKTLGNRHAGFILCLAVVINLIAGSLVMNLNPELYPPFFPFDLQFFFRPVLAVHWWLYLLLVTFSLFAVNITACLIESLFRIRETTTGRLKLFAGIFLHAALLLTLAAHLYDGFRGHSGQATLSPQPVAIAGIGEVSALSVHNTHHPDGSLKDTEVQLRIDPPDAPPFQRRIAYNEPATFAGGRREIIIQGGDNQPAGVALIRKNDGQTIEMMPYQPQRIGDGRLTLKGVYPTQMRVLVAQFVWERVGEAPQLLTMALHHDMARHNKITVAGQVLGYKKMLTVPVATVMTRYNPAIPIILFGLLAALAGTLLQISYARYSRQKSG